MLHESENDRLHALRHASYPPKKNVEGVRIRRKRVQPRFTIGAGPDAELSRELSELMPTTKQFSGSRSVEDLSKNLTDAETFEIRPAPISSYIHSVDSNQNCFAKETLLSISSSTKDDLEIQPIRTKEKESKRRYTMDERDVRSKRPSYNIRPSTELAVTDQDCPPRCSPRRKQSPVPVARDASLEASECLSFDDDGRQLTLTEIHDICLMQSLVTCPPSSSTSMDETESNNTNGNGGDLRSRQASGGNVTNGNGTQTNAANATKSRHASSSANGGATNFDSGFSDTSNTAPYVSSADVTSRGGDSATENLLADVIEYANSSERDVKILLPKPSEFGDGNPFMLIVCLTLLLQHRDTIMKKRMDFNEIAICFDKLMKRHNIRKVLKRARLLFADYLKSSCLERSGSMDKEMPEAVIR